MRRLTLQEEISVIAAVKKQIRDSRESAKLFEEQNEKVIARAFRERIEVLESALKKLEEV